MMPTVVGVDGYREGWVAVALQGGRYFAASVHPAFGDMLNQYPDVQVIAVDIPIGLPQGEPREADVAARKFLRKAASSVFSCPPREVLECPTYGEASAMATRLTGKGITKQSFALGRRILEVDDLVQPGDKVIEVHPEVSFRALANRPLDRKKTWDGAMQRRELLAQSGIDLPSSLGVAGIAPVDDVLDAAVAAWSAGRYARGEAESLPEDPPLDHRGRRVAIWF
jgi:predicted RNase H-like nuclease